MAWQAMLRHTITYLSLIHISEANAKRLAQRRKSEIDPEEYQLFLSAYQKLGPEARTVIDAMVDGISVQVLAEQLGKKMSTVYSYRRDIYEKVGIQGENKLQQLRVRVSLKMCIRDRLYLLDEPIGGVDPATRDYILSTIISNYNPDAAVVISTHLIADVEKVLDEVVFIDRGHLVLQSSVDQIREEKGMSVDTLFREVFKC